jgi:hypothetical protein
MEPEPIFERSVGLPFGYVITARARPSTVRRTVLRLLPWAIFVALPGGRAKTIGAAIANRLSPLARQKVR